MKKLIPIFLILTLLLTSCSAGKKAEDGKLQVYTSFYAVNDFAKTIGGDKAEVNCITPVGAEPHEFEPTAADIAKINKADLFIYHGAGMDDWAKDVAEKLPENVTIVCVSDGINAIEGDPHMWLSFDNAETELTAIEKAYESADSENAAAYKENLENYTKKIDSLKSEYEGANLKGKLLFVTHGAYAYLCKDLGMTQVALEGIAGESDPSPAQMAEFVENLMMSQGKAIYYDPMEESKVAESVAKEAKIEALNLYTFEGDKQNRDYIEVMTENLSQLKKGLN